MTVLDKILKEVVECGFDQDIVDAIVRVELQTSRDLLEKSLEKLRAKEKLKDFEKEDLDYFTKVSQAMETLIEYYTIPGLGPDTEE